MNSERDESDRKVYRQRPRINWRYGVIGGKRSVAEVTSNTAADSPQTPDDLAQPVSSPPKEARKLTAMWIENWQQSREKKEKSGEPLEAEALKVVG